MPSSDLDKGSPASATAAVASANTERASTESPGAKVDDCAPNEPNRKADNVGRPDTDEDEDDTDEEEGEVDESAPPLSDKVTPPLPDEEVPPPLPDEASPGPGEQVDDGWAPVWDDNAQAFYFYNRFTGKSQWENPRVPEATDPSIPAAAGTAAATARTPGTESAAPKPQRRAGGYDPAIHGDYDPNADYAKVYEESREADDSSGQPADAAHAYSATGAFNRFTGRWQADSITPDNYNDEAKSRRQMNAFFDVDAAANAHDGRSLKAERSAKRLSTKEVKAFRDKRREKKEEKRRAWLRD